MVNVANKLFLPNYLAHPFWCVHVRVARATKALLSPGALHGQGHSASLYGDLFE